MSNLLPILGILLAVLTEGVGGLIRMMGFDRERQSHELGSLDELADGRYEWCWVDFTEPTEEETSLLDTFFHFHPLAIEDCRDRLQRPKLDHYDDVHFFVLHAIDPATLKVKEIDLFLSDKLLVTYRTWPSKAVDEARTKLMSRPVYEGNGPAYAAYLLMDKLVDYYFPAVYELEDKIAALEGRDRQEHSSRKLMEKLFDYRARLLKLRRTIVPMRELLYRIINTDKIAGIKAHHAFFVDVHDHLQKLSDMIDSNRELTADIRDSYLSYNSDRMNTIMKTLTVITTIFMPLTFIAGLYGMNFVHMPELDWQYGYIGVLVFMALIGIGMYGWFKKKGWFD